MTLLVWALDRCADVALVWDRWRARRLAADADRRSEYLTLQTLSRYQREGRDGETAMLDDRMRRTRDAGLGSLRDSRRRVSHSERL